MAFQSPRGKLKTAFKKGRVIAPLYTGGPVSASHDGRMLVTCVGEEAILTDIEQGIQVARFTGDGESITSLCISPSDLTLVIFTSSMSLRIYDLPKTTSDASKAISPKRVVTRAHDAPVHVCTFDPTSTYLASGSADGIVKVWDVSRGFTTHVLRGHGGVVSALKFSYPISAGSVEEREMKLVTASVDTKVRVWNLSKTAVEMKKGKQVKPEHVLEGHVSVPRGVDVSSDGRWLVSGGRDAVVLVWDLAAAVKKGSKGKEKALSEPVLVKTVTTVERVEACGLLSEDAEVTGDENGQGSIRFFTAGEKGMVKVWNAKTGKELARFGEDTAPMASSSAGNVEEQEEQRQVVDAIYIADANTVISIHADQNILYHSLSSSTVSRQLVGFNDEIIDAAFLHSPSSALSPSTSHDTHIVLATNSSLIRLYSSHTLDARLLSGHADIVLCLSTSPGREVFASGGKDRTARIWAPRSSSSSAPDGWGWECVAICEGHAESVGALSFSRQGPTPDEEAPKLKFMFTASQDRTIKMWDLSSVATSATSSQSPTKCKSLCTQKAHDKDINALDVSPNDLLVASGSQDRTAKVFSIVYSSSSSAGARGELKLLGTCKGHKRGVWSVRFAKAERVLATGSGDRTVRLWGLEDFSCLRVLEGHSNSVLRVDWLSPPAEGRTHGQGPEQLVSSASDGLVKVWDTRQEECVATLDGHEDKVWALAISFDNRRIVSGAADSVVTFWEDCTQEVEEAREKEREEGVLKEQELQNYVAVNDYHRAITLALSLAHPGRLYNLFKVLSSDENDEDDGSILGSQAVDEVIRTLHSSELAKLLKYVRDWNAKASSSAVAQKVLHAIVKLRSPEEVIKALTPSTFEIAAIDIDGIAVDGSAVANGTKKVQGVDGKEVVEGLIAYTERHLKRMERLVQESYVLDFIVGEMDDGLLDDGVDGMDVDSDSDSS